MKRGLRWVFLSFGALLLAAAALWGASRLWGVRADERAALAQMRAGWTPPGRNGFDAVWTLSYDVPVARQRAVVDADIRTVKAWPAFGLQSTEFRSAATAYPDLRPSDADRDMLCTASKPGCLAMVSADIPAYAGLVARNARLIARADALAGFDHIKLRLPPRADMPLPAFANSYVPATRDALLFAQGKRQEALGNVCRGITGWRRHAANTDMLIASMVANAHAADGYGSLFADMLAAMPADAPIPGQCRLALADVRPAELSLCEAMKGEFAFGYNGMRDLANSPAASNEVSPFARRFLFDAEATSAMNARNMAEACGNRFAGMIAGDVPVEPLPLERHWPRRFACVANAVGCILADIAAPAYASYALRRQDFGMKLRLLGALLWLHENPQPGATLADRLSRRPASLKSPAREIEVGEGGKRLYFKRYEASNGGDWSQPLRL